MERGEIGGLNFRMTFPQQQRNVVPQKQQQSVDEESMLPELSKDPLAVIEKLTANYYDSYATLQHLTKDALSQGIDPFKPDYSQAGGGLAHQAFLEAKANLMHAANNLRAEMDAEKQVRDDIIQGRTRLKQGVDMNGLWALDPNNFVPTAIDPMVTQANQELMQNRYTQRDSNALNTAVRDPKIAHFQQLIQQDPQNAEYYQRQIQALLQNVPQHYAPDLKSKKDDEGKKYSYQISLLKKYTNLKSGVWAPGSYKPVVEGGQTFMMNEEGKGDVLGKYNTGKFDKNGVPIVKDKIVDYWLKDPNTNKVFVKFTDTDLPLEEVSNQSGDAVTRTFVSNNSKYGSVDKIMEAATAMGLTNEFGSSIDDALMPENYSQIHSTIGNEAKQVTKQIEAKKKEINTKLNKLKDAWLFADGVDFPLPDGRVLTVKRHKYSGDNDARKYFIDDEETFELGGEKKPSEGLSSDEIIKYLSDLGYFNQFVKGQTSSNTEIDPDI